MRSREMYPVTVQVPAVGQRGPGWFSVSAGTGVYDVYLEPGWRLLGASPSPVAGANEGALVAWSPGENPPRVRVQFFSSAGGAGAFGGQLTMTMQRTTA